MYQKLEYDPVKDFAPISLMAVTLMAPAGTPAPVIERLNKEVLVAVSSKETAETLDKNGAEPLTSTPAELAAIVKDGVAKYAKVGKTQE